MLAIMAVCFLVGFLGAVTGVGGVLIPPVLMFAGGLETHVAMGTALASLFPLSLLGAVIYARRGWYQPRTAVVFLVGGIIGGIILGQAAVTANIVSPIAIIIVAATGLASYAIPNDVLQLTVYRMRLVLMTASLLGGFWGIIMALLPIIAIAGSTRSFGVAFFAPIAPRTRHTRDLIRRGRAGVTGDREDYMGGSADTQKSGAPTGGEEAQQ